MKRDVRLAGADVVIAGEGRFDDSSLSAKARALSLGKSAQVFAGAVRVEHGRPGLKLHAITPAGTPLDQALREAGANLIAAVRAAF